jgi:hypothetical protein
MMRMNVIILAVYRIEKKICRPSPRNAPGLDLQASGEIDDLNLALAD